jgi:hypothetical protein
MKDLLFLPIDIDLTELNFQQLDNSKKSGSWQGYWDASFISNNTIEQTGFDKILNQLPLTKITRLFHKIQNKPVVSHLDCQEDMIYEEGEYEYLKNIEPGGYRVVLKGNPKALWVFDNKEWHNVILPSVPCCYVLNATACYHKLDADFERETIYMRGYVDQDRHQELLERSLEKYNNYAIRSVRVS